MDDVAKLLTSLLASLVRRDRGVGRLFGVGTDLFILLVIAFLVAKIFWVFMSPTAFFQLGSVAARTGAGSAGAVLVPEPNLIDRFNPFARGLTSQSETVIAEDTPETSLNLKIRSLISSTDPDQSSVRLELPNGSVERFQTEDTIVNGVTLERILSDRIVLLRRGEREVLFASETRVLGVVTPEGTPVIDPTPEAEPAGVAETEAPQEDELQTYRISNFEGLYDRMSPYLRRVATPEGEAVLTIIEGADDEVLTRVGLSIGDQIRQVNNIDLVEYSMSEAYNQLEDEKVLTFAVRRDNTDLDVIIEIGDE